jgi:hypothetical protein
LRLSIESSVTQTRAKATSYRVAPSMVLTANAWFPPGRGAAGGPNGKTQAGAGSVEGAEDLGINTSASCRCGPVGEPDVGAHTVVPR